MIYFKCIYCLKKCSYVYSAQEFVFAADYRDPATETDSCAFDVSQSIAFEKGNE